MKKLHLIILSILLAATSFAEGKKFTLVIDAGHGGRDGGAVSNGAKEKNINLNVALAFGRLVEQNCQDVKVIYTRKTDVFIPLHERADIANRNKADVFISIHTNAVERGNKIRGMETYTMGMRRSDEKLSTAQRENEVVLIESDYQQHYAGFDPRSPESYIIFDYINETNMVNSVELASLIQRNVCSTAGRPNKGVKQDAFLVLRETSMPACLVELGYITTPSEATYLTNRNNVEAMGRGLYQAFIAYKQRHSGRAATPAPTPPANQDRQQQQDQQEQQQNQQQQQQEEELPQPQQEQQQPELPQSDAPVFKVQFLSGVNKLRDGDPQFKGLTGVDSYKDGNMWKYTVGSSTDYNEIYQLRKEVVKKFPQAFIIAFKNGQRVDTQAAYQEFKRNRQ